VRNVDGDLWRPSIFGLFVEKHFYVLGGICWIQCIPYEGNEHLSGKTDACDEYYKTWDSIEKYKFWRSK
jgi:hypothetical protein